jgi:enoyl-CoA hydratase/carnithine racemase
MTETDDTVLLRIEADVARISLNRPAKRHAMTRAMWRAIADRVARAEAAPAARVMLLDSVGEHFCAGADLSELAASEGDPDASRAAARDIQRALDAIAGSRLPSIALIRGACVGGGCSLALACDLRLAAASARFAITPARLGLVYNHPQTAALVARVGPGRARDLLFTGRTLTASEALAIGLIEHLWPDRSFAAEAQAYVDLIRAASPASIRATRVILGAIESGAVTETADTRAAFETAFNGADFAEGFRAFVEKRRPRFQ